MDKKKQVAIIDDEVEITEFLKEFLLDSIDCDVDIFNDPLMALEQLKIKSYDAISLDHRMPGLKGMDLVKILRTSEGPNIKTKILLITGNLEEAECAHPDLISEVIFLEKPIKHERYIRWINFFLNSSDK